MVRKVSLVISGAVVFVRRWQEAFCYSGTRGFSQITTDHGSESLWVWCGWASCAAQHRRWLS
jgi:hypothetical protein